MDARWIRCLEIALGRIGAEALGNLPPLEPRSGLEHQRVDAGPGQFVGDDRARNARAQDDDIGRAPAAVVHHLALRSRDRNGPGERHEHERLFPGDGAHRLRPLDRVGRHQSRLGVGRLLEGAHHPHIPGRDDLARDPRKLGTRLIERVLEPVKVVAALLDEGFKLRHSVGKTRETCRQGFEGGLPCARRRSS